MVIKTSFKMSHGKGFQIAGLLFFVLGCGVITFGIIQLHKEKHDSTYEIQSSNAIELMHRVADYQLANFSTDPTWINAVFAIGVMALFETRPTSHQKYLNAMMAYANANNWQPGPNFRNANDLAIGQLYAELCFVYKNRTMIANFQKRIDEIMKQPMPGRKDWWWCDALFMAPPALARLSIAVKDSKYTEFMDKQWWDSATFLYNPDYNLFYRDAKYFNKTEINGQKVFWSRGNGWVLAALARILQFIDGTSPIRESYVKMYVDMASKIASIQQPDGFWRTSLLDPEDHPGGETSGTALYCYALAWGINHGLLSKSDYFKVVTLAWEALASIVEPDGKLGWVQKPGEAPAPVSANDSFPYGAGSFLLAGSEMHKLLQF